MVISDDELKEAAPDKSAAIEIQEFVNESLGNPARNRAASAGQREAGPERISPQADGIMRERNADNLVFQTSDSCT